MDVSVVELKLEDLKNKAIAYQERLKGPEGLNELFTGTAFISF